MRFLVAVLLLGCGQVVCPQGTVARQVCVQCGPADGCAEVAECATPCDPGPCGPCLACVDHACQALCP